jgi:hypothetical protein
MITPDQLHNYQFDADLMEAKRHDKISLCFHSGRSVDYLQIDLCYQAKWAFLSRGCFLLFSQTAQMSACPLADQSPERSSCQQPPQASFTAVDLSISSKPGYHLPYYSDALPLAYYRC